MENKTIKNLIILGVIVFSFALTNNVSAYYSNYAFNSDPIVIRNNPYGYYDVNQDYSQSQYRYVPVYQNNNPYYSYSQVYPQYAYNSSYNTETKTPVINNYYYQTAPTTVAKTTTTTKTNTDTSNTTTDDINGVYRNNLGASAYNGSDQAKGNGITALSLRGSGGFMPSSIWQWIFVIILILIIIIISRMFVKKPISEESHTTHVH